MSTAISDRDELRARIGELEELGKFAEAAALKTALIRPQPTPLDPRRDASRATLKARIAALEAAGKFAEAAPLKTELMQLQ